MITPHLPTHHPSLNRSRGLEKLWTLIALRLEIRVAANVLLADEDVWNGSLAAALLKSVLESAAVIYFSHEGDHLLAYRFARKGRRSGRSTTYQLDRARLPHSWP